MNVQKTTNINFNAKLLSKTYVKRINELRCYRPQEAFFVEIEPNNLEDIYALEKIYETWTNEIFAGKILNTSWMLNTGMYDSDFHSIYALTTQQKNHKQLNPDDVLCIMEVLRSEPKSVYLNYIQGRTDTIYGSEGLTEFKHIGKATIKALREHFAGLAITLNPTKAAEKFYAKIGFKCERKKPLKYRLDPNDPIK